MQRFWSFLRDFRFLLLCLGVGAAVVIVQMGAPGPLLLLIIAALMLIGLGWALALAAKRQSCRKLAHLVLAPWRKTAPAESQEIESLRKTMQAAISKLRGSKIGVTRGAAALYELPWYMVIGNPAAGKSSAILHSGLQFPFSEERALQGVGGTRHCDWFFTTEGILLDTAGRYTAHEHSHAEWMQFLELLRRNRPKAPINGIVIAASMAEISESDPDSTIELARSLRLRVQELTEKLEVFAPVYVVFTKCDLIEGFNDFFSDCDAGERERIWGATRRFRLRKDEQDILAFFDQHFDELYDGLKEISLANMAQHRSGGMLPGMFSFPVDFLAKKSAMRAFLATLFQENSYQFKPVFRGFYLTSARPGEAASGAPCTVPDSAAVNAKRFALTLAPQAAQRSLPDRGYFLSNLFRDVIFADRHLVENYVSPRKAKLRAAVFACAIVGLGLCLGGMTWSYANNRQLIANARADLVKIVQLQRQQGDLQSRLEAMQILQDRLAQLEALRRDRPWSLKMGLFQGEALEEALRQHYFAGIGELMLKPVGASLEAALTELGARPTAAGQPALAAAEDGYNTLKTYLMLGAPAKAETAHLSDQLARHWRTWLEANRGSMAREQMIRGAERLISFYVTQSTAPGWRRIDPKLGLVEQCRTVLRPAVRGLPARERVYAEIRARANTRFAPMTVARMVDEQDQKMVTGSYAVPGGFTQQAWNEFVRDAFRKAASQQTKNTDWVLNVTASDDLTLEGSPEQVTKSLTDLYKAEYVMHWKAFVQGVAIRDLHDFADAVRAMNRLGDPELSPLTRVLRQTAQETGWDGAPAAGTMAKQGGAVSEWFRSRFSWLRSSSVDTPPSITPQTGVIAPEFAALARLNGARGEEAAPLQNYLNALSKLRGRLNQLSNQGDPGPGARQLLQQTLDGAGSELADAMKLVEEQLLVGIPDGQKQVLRPLLVRPLMQTFAVIVQPAEAELNKTWHAQVFSPFQSTLADKAPFSPHAGTVASRSDLERIFGPAGAIARFAEANLGPLVVRRGDVMSPRTWGGMGVNFSPELLTGFPSWVSLNQAGDDNAGGAGQTTFELRPVSTAGALEYVVDVNGQKVQSRGERSWTRMVYSPESAQSGVTITAVTIDGRRHEVFSGNGPDGLKRMIDAAARKRKNDGIHELTWTKGDIAVTVDLRLTATPPANRSVPLYGLRLPAKIAGAGPRGAASAGAMQ